MVIRCKYKVPLKKKRKKKMKIRGFIYINKGIKWDQRARGLGGVIAESVANLP